MEMDFLSKAGNAARFIVKQAEYFLEIIMLKIRIIGFANKRSDLFARLGRQVYSSRDDPGEGQAGSESLMAVIEETEREIREAEESITNVKEKARAGRGLFLSGMNSGTGSGETAGQKTQGE